MDDLDLWNRHHKIKKQKLILEIKTVLDADYKLGLRFFIQKVEDRKYQWDVYNDGKEKSIMALISVMEHVLKFEQDSSFPVRPMHEKAIKSILRNYKIDELLNESGEI